MRLRLLSMVPSHQSDHLAHSPAASNPSAKYSISTPDLGLSTKEIASDKSNETFSTLSKIPTQSTITDL